MGRRPLWRSTTLHPGKTTSAPPANIPCGHQLYKMDEVCCHSDTELSFEGEAKSTDMLRDRQQAEERLLLRETRTQERSRGDLFGSLFTIANRASPDLTDCMTRCQRPGCDDRSVLRSTAWHLTTSIVFDLPRKNRSLGRRTGIEAAGAAWKRLPLADLIS